jgi:hypothetical protein
VDWKNLGEFFFVVVIDSTHAVYITCVDVMLTMYMIMLIIYKQV